jgi:thiol-disulfide isomerase/thioredoxin
VLTGTDQPAREPASPPALGPPKTVPAVVLPDITGKRRSLSEWHGRPLLINFWATWCGPCREEIPMLIKLRAEHAKDGLEIIGVALDFHDAVAGYASKAGMDYPVLVAAEDMTAVQAFGMGASAGLPTTLVADRDGKIVSRHVGALDRDEAEELLKPVL